MNENERDIMPYHTCEAMVETVKATLVKIRDAYQLLLDAQDALKNCAGFNMFGIGAIRHNHNSTCSVTGDDCDFVVKHIKRAAWQAVIAKLRVHEILTVERKRQLDDDVENDRLPPFTLENVIATARELVSQYPHFTVEVVKEVYDYLRPRNSNLKTNDRFAVGERVILSYVCSRTWGKSWHVQEWQHDNRRQALRNLGVVMRLLDGKGVDPSYSGEITDAIHATPLSENTCETEYFALKMCANQNLHIRFKRMDLVQRINEVAGSGSLHCGPDSTKGRPSEYQRKRGSEQQTQPTTSDCTAVATTKAA